MSKKHFNILCLLLVISQLSNLFACTTFVYKKANQNLIYGRNFDYPISNCQIIVNKHNMQKKSLPIKDEKTLEWTSRYGSITFNQFGREFPYGGMNEAGLVIELMEHRDTILPELDKRYGLTELQWVQYQLDTAKSVKQVIDSDKRVRVSKSGNVVPLHYLVADQFGNIATIEYINGKMQVHTAKSLKYPVLTNNSYTESLEYLKQIDVFGGKKALTKTGKSLDRFASTCLGLSSFKNPNSYVNDAFKILKNADKDNTQWNTVYDMKNKIIYFKSKNNQNTRIVEFKNFNFSGKTKPLYADIDDNMNNGKLIFSEHTYDINLKILELSYEKLKKFIPANINYEGIAKYAETIKEKKSE